MRPTSGNDGDKLLGLAAMIHARASRHAPAAPGQYRQYILRRRLVGFPGGLLQRQQFAVEGLSEGLSKEVAPFGIKVLVVEPGPFRTDWAGRSLKKSKGQIPDYAETGAHSASAS